MGGTHTHTHKYAYVHIFRLENHGEETSTLQA
jgi:hypothetical protein